MARRAAPRVTPVHNAISRLLAERGWTDAALAARTGVDRAHLNQLKNGRALPSVATALRVALAFRVPVVAVFPPGSAVRRRPPRRPTSGRRS